MRLSVNVPVLSVAITVTEPSASTADRRRTTARCRAMRSTPRASATVSTAGSPSGTAATASATAKMIISGARDSPSASTPATPRPPASASTQVAMRRPSWSTRRSSGVCVTAISPSIVARRPIALDRAGAGDLEEGLPADDQRAAERLVSRRLVHGHRLARENGFIDHGAVGVDERAVGRHAVAGLEPDPVARDEVGAGHPHEVSVAQDPGLGGGERLEACQGRLGSLFLIEAEGRVEQQDHGDGQGLDGPPVRALVDPQARIEDEREEQDVDERALKLADEATPHRVGRAFRQRVRTDLHQPRRRLCCRESRHDNRLPKRSGRG